MGVQSKVVFPNHVSTIFRYRKKQREKSEECTYICIVVNPRPAGGGGGGYSSHLVCLSVRLSSSL